MKLTTISLLNFRNLKDTQLNFSESVNFISGKNGQGKTNLLEAIYLLSTGKSFRTSSIDQLIKDDSNNFSECFIEGEIIDNLGNLELGIAVAKKQKNYFHQKNKVKSLSEFIGKLITVTFIPADLYIVKGSSSLRREFIDKHLFDLKPSCLKILASVTKAIKQKNYLLSSNNIGNTKEKAEEIRAWNFVIAKYSSELIKARREFISKLNTTSSLIHSNYAKNDENLNVVYKENLKGADTEEDIYKILESNLASEIQQKRVLVGPHKDDILLYLGDKNSKKSEAKHFASQGQSRSIILSLKLAVVEMIEQERKESPVILLDDMSSELDRERNELFVEEVCSGKFGERQIFITSTDMDIRALNPEHSQRIPRQFAVEGGIFS